jgi:hypothetical protein
MQNPQSHLQVRCRYQIAQHVAPNLLLLLL